MSNYEIGHVYTQMYYTHYSKKLEVIGHSEQRLPFDLHLPCSPQHPTISREMHPSAILPSSVTGHFQT